MPASKQACPTNAACWSPIIEQMGKSTPNNDLTAIPKSATLSRTSGNILRGILNRASSSSSHSTVAIFSNKVREALVASVACTFPSVKRHNKKVSIVPNNNCPASARARAPSTLSNIQAIFVAEK